jgi:hypothetical protein
MLIYIQDRLNELFRHFDFIGQNEASPAVEEEWFVNAVDEAVERFKASLIEKLRTGGISRSS